MENGELAKEGEGAFVPSKSQGITRHYTATFVVV